MTRIAVVEVSGVCLGVNVFGWSDRDASFAVLDAFVEAAAGPRTSPRSGCGRRWRSPSGTG